MKCPRAKTGRRLNYRFWCYWSYFFHLSAHAAGVASDSDPKRNGCPLLMKEPDCKCCHFLMFVHGSHKLKSSGWRALFSLLLFALEAWCGVCWKEKGDFQCVKELLSPGCSSIYKDVLRNCNVLYIDTLCNHTYEFGYSVYMHRC